MGKKDYPPGPFLPGFEPPVNADDIRPKVSDETARFLRFESHGGKKAISSRGKPRVRASDFRRWDLPWQTYAVMKNVQVVGRRDPAQVKLDKTLNERRAQASRTRTFRMMVNIGSTIQTRHGRLDQTATKGTDEQDVDGLRRMVAEARRILRRK